MEEGIRFAEGLTPVAVEVDQFEQAAALRLTRRRDAETGSRSHGERSCCRRARSSSPPAPSPTPCWRAKTRRIVALDGRYFQALDEDGNKVTPQRVAKPDAAHVLMQPARRTAARSASSATCIRASPAMSSRRWAGRSAAIRSSAACWRAAPPRAPTPEELKARLDDELRARVHEVDAPDAEDRRGGRAGADGGARVPAGPVLPPAELRDLCRSASTARRLAMEGLALTGAWIDRDQGLLSTIVLEMGGSSDLCALLGAGRAGDPDGPDRHADRNPGRRDRAAGRRRARQRGAVLDRRGAAGRGLARALFRRLQDHRRPLQDRRYRDAPPTASSGAATRRRASRRAGRRTAPLSATSSRRSRPTARARSARSRSRLAAVDRIIAIGSDGMMNGGRARRAAPGSSPISGPTTGRSRRSTRRCSA